MKKIKQISLLFSFCITGLLTAKTRNFLELFEESQKKPTIKLINKKPPATSPHDEGKNLATHLLTMKAHDTSSENFSWRVYYEGHIITDTKGVFRFFADANTTTFTIVVARIKVPTTSSISGFEVPEGTEFLCYNLKRAEDWAQPKKYRWNITTKKGCDGLTIPKNALIVFLEPEHIKTIEMHKWDKKNNIIVLPTLVLKNSPMLAEASIKTVLAALDTDSFHGRSEYETSQEEATHMQRTKLS